MTTITKSTFLNTVACPTYGWLSHAGKLRRLPTTTEEFRLRQGLEIGERARNSMPGGILVDIAGNQEAAQMTRQLMSDPSVKTLYEATFVAGDLVTRADILKRENSGWHMIEVKSSTLDKSEFIDDMAYTTMVMRLAGVVVHRTSIMLVSKDYRLGMEPQELFKLLDHSEAVLARAREFADIRDSVAGAISTVFPPEADLRYECRNCSVFDECKRDGIANHVLRLPRISNKKFRQLDALGVYSIEDIPADFSLTANQAKVKASIEAGEPIIEAGLAAALKTVRWPAYYLDFETFQTAIPLYPDTPPYTQIPTQYSIHICSGPGQVVEHREYLAAPEQDPRRELAIGLIRDLGTEGSIIVYSNFEKNIINGLAGIFSDLEPALQAIIERLVDLEVIVRNNYSHPGFGGRTSIKVVLPTMVPELSYEGLGIGDGETAMVTYARMVMGEYEGDEMERLKGELLEYCKMDTMAMVRLHEALVKEVVVEAVDEPPQPPYPLFEQGLRLMVESIQERPFRHYWWPQLSEAFRSNPDDIIMLAHILFELSFRSKKNAIELREDVVQKINDLRPQSFEWPSTEAPMGDGTIDDQGWPEQGLLSYMGYCVGTNGIPQSERLGLLNYIYYQELPNVNDPEYMNGWGTPRTGPRLQKMANSIASFIRMAKRRSLASLGPAIRDWTDDLEYLHDNYYVGRYDFVWPIID